MTVKIISILISLFIISGCSSSTEIAKNYNKSKHKAITTHTASSNLGITIPSGWREIKDNHEQLFDIWLVNDQNNAVICFIPIYLSDDLKNKPFEENLKIIEQIVIINKQSNGEDFQIVQEKKEVTNYQIKSIKFKFEDDIKNSIIFGSENKFYECLAYFKNNYNPSPIEIERLIKIQEKIVKDSSFK
jgi:hypothetical protein